MNRLDRMTTDKRSTGDIAIDQLLEALDLEAASLSPDVTDNLASARHQALTTMRLGVTDKTKLHCSVDHTPHLRAVASAARSRASQHPRLPSKWELAGNSLFPFMYATPAFKTAMAGIGVASLTALLFLDGAEPQETREELVAMATADSSDLPAERLEQTTPTALQATAFDTQPDQHLPLIDSKDSLDLVGSVDFLLWLDSQQG